MAKVKPKRRGIHTDMTAMSDVAWLLLSYFVMTATFSDAEKIEVFTPTSIATRKLDDSHLMRVTLDENGKFFFKLTNREVRKDVLQRMGDKYSIQFTDAEKTTFENIEDFGVPMREMRQYLNSPADVREKYNPGIPMDSVKVELADWVFEALENDERTRLAIRGDVKAKYPEFRTLIKELQKRNMNKFELITSTESGPKD